MDDTTKGKKAASEAEKAPEKVREVERYERGTIKVHVDEWRYPDGKLAERQYAEVADAAVVLPVAPDGKILLIKQFRVAAERGEGKWIYEAIAGKIDPKKIGGYETPEENVVKEAAEEGGLTLKGITRIGSGFSSPGRMTERMHIFYADVAGRGKQDLESGESIRRDFLEVAPADALELIKSGEIEDVKTIAAIQGYIIDLMARTAKERGLDMSAILGARGADGTIHA